MVIRHLEAVKQGALGVGGFRKADNELVDGFVKKGSEMQDVIASDLIRLARRLAAESQRRS